MGAFGGPTLKGHHFWSQHKCIAELVRTPTPMDKDRFKESPSTARKYVDSSGKRRCVGTGALMASQLLGNIQNITVMCLLYSDLVCLSFVLTVGFCLKCFMHMCVCRSYTQEFGQATAAMFKTYLEKSCGDGCHGCETSMLFGWHHFAERGDPSYDEAAEIKLLFAQPIDDFMDDDACMQLYIILFCSIVVCLSCLIP